MTPATKTPPLCTFTPGVPGCTPPPGVCVEARCETTGDVSACLIVQVPCAQAVPIDSLGDLFALFLVCVLVGWIAIARQQDQRDAQQPRRPKYPQE